RVSRSASCLYLIRSPSHSDIHSFPTRRSSDLKRCEARLYRRVVRRSLTHRVEAILKDAHRAIRRSERRERLAEGGVEVRAQVRRSEEHTSELQSRFDLVCRLLLEKKTASYPIL